MVNSDGPFAIKDVTRASVGFPTRSETKATRFEEYLQSLRKGLSLKGRKFHFNGSPGTGGLYSSPILVHNMAKNLVQWSKFGTDALAKAR